MESLPGVPGIRVSFQGRSDVFASKRVEHRGRDDRGRILRVIFQARRGSEHAADRFLVHDGTAERHRFEDLLSLESVEQIVRREGALGLGVSMY